MEWIILIFVLLAARGNTAAAPSPVQRPVSTLPVQQGHTPITDVELHVNPNLDPSNQMFARALRAIARNAPVVDRQRELSSSFGAGNIGVGGQFFQ